MAAFDLDGWLQQHGGEAEAVSINAAGDVEHRARDGSYVVIRRDGTSAMTGFRGEPAAAPAAPPPPRGSGMNQQELEALLAEIAPNGDPRRLVHSMSTKSVTVSVPGKPGQPATKRAVDVPVQEWVDPGTGRTLTVEGDGQGGWKQTFNGVKTENQGKPAVTPEQQQASEGTRSVTAVRGTDGKTYTRTVTVPPAGQGPPTVKTYDPDGTEVQTVPGEVEGSKPSVQQATRNGKSYTVVTTMDAAGHPTTTTYDAGTNQIVPGGLPAEATKPGVQSVTRNGKTYTVVTSLDPTTNQPAVRAFAPDGQEVPGGLPDEAPVGATGSKPVDGHPGYVLVTGTTKDAAGNETTDTHYERADTPGVRVELPSAGAGIKNVEPFRPDPSDPNRDLGITAWAQKQRAKIGLPPEQGGITKEDYDAAVKEAHDLATSYASNVVSSEGVERNRRLDTEAQREHLSGEASTDYGRAQTMLESAIRYAVPGSPAIKDLIPGIMAEQAKYRQQRQATAPPMPALHPMFQWSSDASAAAANGQSQPPPPVAETRPPTEQPAAAPAPEPAFRPPPPIEGQTPVQAPASPEQSDVPGMFDGLMARQPLQMPPGPSPDQPSGPGLFDPMAQQAARPAFDPMAAAGRAAELGIPHDALAQALRELGWA